MTTEGVGNDHEFERVERGTSYVLVCACGWRSGPSDSAQQVGDQWDHHRAMSVDCEH